MANENGRRQRPIFTKRYFPVQVAVFEHRNGDGKLNHSVVLRRSFRRDEESEWETTEYLSTQDLLPGAKLLSEAYAFIQSRLQKAYEDGRQAPDLEVAAADVPF